MTNVLLRSPGVNIFDGKTEVMLDCESVRILREVGLPIVEKDFEEIKLVFLFAGFSSIITQQQCN